MLRLTLLWERAITHRSGRCLADEGSTHRDKYLTNEDEQIILSDKKLCKEWVASLDARGEPLTAAGEELKFIVIPISGICTGQVCLGGVRPNAAGFTDRPKTN